MKSIKLRFYTEEDYKKEKNIEKRLKFYERVQKALKALLCFYYDFVVKLFGLIGFIFSLLALFYIMVVENKIILPVIITANIFGYIMCLGFVIAFLSLFMTMIIKSIKKGCKNGDQNKYIRG